MNLSVSEVSRLCGVSVRTLHYYDQIGLLAPDGVTQAGYRQYDREAIDRLQRILLLRELDFPLAEIPAMLEAADPKELLQKQRELLQMKKQRLERIIALCSQLIEGKEVTDMNAFDESQINQTRKQYAEEAKQKWGQTDAYRESEQRTAAYTKADWQSATKEADDIFAAFAALRGQSPAGDAVQALVSRWQQHITARYYPCTDEILQSLGQMYVADERFRQNIDRFGEGTAQLMSDAIAARG